MEAVFDTIILAGGTGSRLSSVISDRPKCLAPIHRRPFLSYLLDQLVQAGLTNVILSTGHMADHIEDALGLRYGSIQLHYSEEKKPLGTGGAVRRAALSYCASDYLLVLNGDSYLDFDLMDFLAWFNPTTMRLGMALAEVADSRRFGQVITGEDGQVRRFEEKNESSGPGWVNAGIYVILKSALTGLPAPENFSLEHDYFPAQIGRGFYARGYRGRFIDIGTPASYEDAGEFFSRKA